MNIDFTKIAPYLKDPLVLIGFFLFLAFIFARYILKKGIIPPLPATLGYKILKIILLYGFLLGILLILLGFGLRYRQEGRLGFNERRRLEFVDLSSLTLDCSLSYSLDDSIFERYRERFLSKFEQLKHRLNESQKDLLTDNSLGIELLRIQKSKGERYALTILPSSELWPDHNNPEEKEAALILGGIGLLIFISKTEEEPMTPRTHHPEELMIVIGGRIDGRSPFGVRLPGGKLIYDSLTQRLMIFAKRIPTDLDYSDDFISKGDFIHAKVTVQTAANAVPSLKFGGITLNFEKKGILLIPGVDESQSDKDGEMIFETTIKESGPAE
jgi:hypothetical protein